MNSETTMGTGYQTTGWVSDMVPASGLSLWHVTSQRAVSVACDQPAGWVRDEVPARGLSGDWYQPAGGVRDMYWCRQTVGVMWHQSAGIGNVWRQPASGNSTEAAPPPTG